MGGSAGCALERSKGTCVLCCVSNPVLAAAVFLESASPTFLRNTKLRCKAFPKMQSQLGKSKRTKGENNVVSAVYRPHASRGYLGDICVRLPAAPQCRPSQPRDLSQQPHVSRIFRPEGSRPPSPPPRADRGLCACVSGQGLQPGHPAAL